MTDNHEHEPDLGDVLRAVWRLRLYVLAGGVIAVLVAAAFVKLATPLYRATMIIAPADGYALGDYASSVPYDKMLSLPFWRPTDPEGISTDYYRFIHTVRGAMAADILRKDSSVLGGIDQAGGPRLRDLSGPPDQWSAELLSDYLTKQIKIEPLGATPLRRMQYDHPDAAFAAALLRKIHLVADQMIRRSRKRQSQSRVEYLNAALDKTLNPDHRRVIANLLMQQEHVRMLANMDEPYAAIVVEPASTGPRPHWPNPYLFIAGAAIAGMFAGYLGGAFLRAVRARARETDST